MTVKNFGFAARAKANKAAGKPARKDIPFKLDGARDAPTFHVRGDFNENALAVISAQFMRADGNKNLAEMSAGLFETLEAVFTPDTVRGLLAKIKDPDSGFGFEELGEIIEWATEEHTARPTTSSRT